MRQFLKACNGMTSGDRFIDAETKVTSFSNHTYSSILKIDILNEYLKLPIFEDATREV